MRSSRRNLLRAKFILPLSLSLMALAGALLYGANRAEALPPSYWEASLGGHYLQAGTLWASYGSYFEAGGVSVDNTAPITSIGVTSYGYTKCDGFLYQRWYQSATNYNSQAAGAAGSANYFGCFWQNCNFSYSYHSFYQAGSFGANPVTGNGYEC